MLISLDTETTGLDLRHAARPFLVTICHSSGTQLHWRWDVDPVTRKVGVVSEHLDEIRAELTKADTIVLQNAKFDCAALASVGITEFPWEKVQDTLIASHLLHSNSDHNLTALAATYLRLDIYPFEKAVNDAVNAARRKVQQAQLKVRREKGTGDPLEHWCIANSGVPGMPSAEGKFWKFDMWLPRIMAEHLKYPPGHPWYTVLEEYANTDSSVTLLLWIKMEKEIKRRNLWAIYRETMKVCPIAYRMEAVGVPAIKSNLDLIRKKYETEVARLGEVCSGIAESLGHKLELPKGASPNNNLRTFFFDILKVEQRRGKKAKTSAPTLDKEAMSHYLATLPTRSKAFYFVKTLLDKRARDTSLAYMRAYERFWLPTDHSEYFLLYPSLNPTGTSTLRWSSSNPNEQNISKKESECPECKGEGRDCLVCEGSGIELYSVRMCFGPPPGWEMWSCDGKNLELRIPSYEAEEPDMIALFEKPDEPPYYGSNHLLNFHTAYPDLWEAMEREVGFEKVGPACKKKYGATWYQWNKNGGFALQYGGGRATVDRSYHKAGVYDLLSSRFARLLGPGGLNERCIRFAEKHGYIETMPDRTVDPVRGYPLMCTRTEWGKILPTVPLNYRVQGTACWWMRKAMVRCQDKLDRWNAPLPTPAYLMIMQVHDELAFLFRKTKRHPKDDYELEKQGKLPLLRPHPDSGLPGSSNLWRIRIMQKLMEEGGRDIGVPTPVSCEYHEKHWAEGITL